MAAYPQVYQNYLPRAQVFPVQVGQVGGWQAQGINPILQQQQLQQQQQAAHINKVDVGRAPDQGRDYQRENDRRDERRRDSGGRRDDHGRRDENKVDGEKKFMIKDRDLEALEREIEKKADSFVEVNDICRQQARFHYFLKHRGFGYAIKHSQKKPKDSRSGQGFSCQLCDEFFRTRLQLDNHAETPEHKEMSDIFKELQEAGDRFFKKKKKGGSEKADSSGNAPPPPAAGPKDDEETVALKKALSEIDPTKMPLDDFILAAYEKVMNDYWPLPSSDFYCRCCNYTTFQTQKQLDLHLKSARHLENERQYDAAFCLACQFHTGDFEGMRMHVQSDRHKKIQGLMDKARDEAVKAWEYANGASQEPVSQMDAPPSFQPPPTSMPPASMPPSSMPPISMPPSSMPPSSMPPSSMPPPVSAPHHMMNQAPPAAPTGPVQPPRPSEDSRSKRDERDSSRGRDDRRREDSRDRGRDRSDRDSDRRDRDRDGSRSSRSRGEAAPPEKEKVEVKPEETLVIDEKKLAEEKKVSDIATIEKDDFVVPLTGYMCCVCNETLPNEIRAAQHIKTTRHQSNSNKLITKFTGKRKESSEPPTALSEEPAAKKPAMDRPEFQPPLQDQRPPAPSQGQGLLPTPDNYGAPPMARPHVNNDYNSPSARNVPPPRQQQDMWNASPKPGLLQPPPQQPQQQQGGWKERGMGGGQARYRR